MGVTSTLRPLGVGERIDAAFKAYRSNFRTMAKALVIVVVIGAVIEALITVSMTATSPIVTHVGINGNTTTIDYNGLWTFFAGLGLIGLISWLLGMWASATCIQIVGTSFVGREVDWRQARSRATRRLGSLTWLAILVTCLIIGAGIVLLAPGVLLNVAGLTVPGAILTVIGSLAWFVFAIWFGVAQILAVPTLVLEDYRGLRAIRRSFALVKGTWWSVFGTLILMELIILLVYLATGIVFAIFTLLTRHNEAANFVRTVVQTSATLIIATPFTATIYAILAIDMRIRKEGFDLELLAQELESVATDRPVGHSAPPSAQSFPSLIDDDRPEGTTSDPPPGPADT